MPPPAGNGICNLPLSTRKRAHMITRNERLDRLTISSCYSTRRAFPVAAALVAAALGLAGAGWAKTPPEIATAAAPASASIDDEDAGVTVSGRVVDEEGTLLPGATVVLRPPEEDGGFVAIADEHGGFAIEGVPSGPYFVEAELAGFTFETEALILGSEEQRQITVTGVARAALDEAS
jgi:hypothetical protein